MLFFLARPFRRVLSRSIIPERRQGWRHAPGSKGRRPMTVTVRSLLLLAALLALPLLSPARADESDPEPPGSKLKVLDEKDDEVRLPDVIFVPTPQDVVVKMLESARVTKKDVVFSLGCGDGRNMVTASKTYGCRSVGFDIDPERVKDSKANIEKNKLEKLA